MSLTIEIRRDAINNEDSVEAYRTDISQFSSLEEFVNYLVDIGYLPLPTKDEEFWCLRCVRIRYPWTNEPNKKQEIYSEIGRIYSSYKTFCNERIHEIFTQKSINAHFKFFPNSLSRAEYLFKLFDGSLRWMYNDGYDSEYLSYKVSNEIEEVWKSQLSNIEK
jgi:hypothetical protein